MHGREYHRLMSEAHYNRALIFSVLFLMLLAHDVPDGPARWLSAFLVVRNFGSSIIHYRRYYRGDDI